MRFHNCCWDHMVPKENETVVELKLLTCIYYNISHPTTVENVSFFMQTLFLSVVFMRNCLRNLIPITDRSLDYMYVTAYVITS